MSLAVLASACGGEAKRASVRDVTTAYTSLTGVPLRVDPQRDLAGVTDTEHCVELKPAGPDGYAAGTYNIYVETRSGACAYVSDEAGKHADSNGLHWQYFPGTGSEDTQFYAGYVQIGNVMLEVMPSLGQNVADGLARLQANLRAAERAS